MGLIKFAAKAVGTVALTATGAASYMLNLVTSSALGAEIPLFSTIQDGSFNTIRKMWKSEQSEDELADETNGDNSLQRAINAKYRAATTAQNQISFLQKAIEKAYQSGTPDPDKVNELQGKIDAFQERYDDLMAQAREMEDELAEQQLYQE